MILLLGGTTETAAAAGALAAAGRRVLVSTATDVPLDVGNHANITRRCGRLDAAAMAAVVKAEQVRAVVDVSHPYAVELRATARRVAREAGIPYLTFVRPQAFGAAEGIRLAADHAEAARLACEPGRPVLLTVGSRSVSVYAREAERKKVPLIARVLPHEESVGTCLAAGLPREHIIVGRGPFDVEATRELIRRFGIGVVVTKDSGEAGGFPAKQEAARLESCLMIVVGRAPREQDDAFDNLEDLVMSVKKVTSAECRVTNDEGQGDEGRAVKGDGNASSARPSPLDPRPSALVLLAHGSRNPNWRAPFDHLLKSLRKEAGEDRVYLAYLQMASPSLADVVDELASRRVRTIRILPLLMSAGNHAYEDIPAEVAALQAKHSGLSVEILPPIGSHLRFKAMLEDLVKESLAEHPPA